MDGHAVSVAAPYPWAVPHGSARSRVSPAVSLPPFQRLVDDHTVELHRFLVGCVGADAAEDCLQETFMSALRAYPRLRHADNLRAWLFRTFLPLGVEPFAMAARDSGLAEDVQRGLVEDFTELAANPPERYDSRLGELLGYIPNLRDVGQSTGEEKGTG